MAPVHARAARCRPLGSSQIPSAKGGRTLSSQEPAPAVPLGAWAAPEWAGRGVRVTRFGHCGITRSFLGPISAGSCFLRVEQCCSALREGIAVKDIELKQVLRSLTKALDDPRFGPDQRMKLQRAKRDLREVAQAGKFDRSKVFRAVEMIATVFLDSDELPHDQRSE